MKKLLLTLFAVSALLGAVTGCNTTRGAGEDLEDAGEEIQDTANDVME